MRNRLITLLMSLSVLISCERNIQRMFSNAIVFPESLSLIRGTQQYHNSLQDSLYKLIVYIDSTECSSCRINNMHSYNELAKKAQDTEKFMLVIIVSPSTDAGRRLSKMIKHKGFPFDIYIDDSNNFLEMNSFIPASIRFHSFLTDPANRPVLIGDPTKSARVNYDFNAILGSDKAQK